MTPRAGAGAAVARRAGGVVVCAVLVLLAGAHGAAQEHVQDAVARMQLVDMDGTRWTADRLRGRVTLIDFWATWCAPCLADLPYLKQARARYAREEFEVLGVSFDRSDRRSFVSWINRQAVTWPQVFDGRGRQGDAARLFRVAAVPTSFLVGPDGQVVAVNLRGERLLAAVEAAIQRLRAERGRDMSVIHPPPPAASTPRGPQS